jgi:hypothetical protein
MAVAPHVTERLFNHITGTVSGVAAVYIGIGLLT